LIQPYQITGLMRSSEGSELAAKVHGFSYDEVMRVYQRAVDDKDEAAQEELLPILMEKQSRLLEEGRYQEAVNQ
jgi:hypothetical protein